MGSCASRLDVGFCANWPSGLITSFIIMSTSHIRNRMHRSTLVGPFGDINPVEPKENRLVERSKNGHIRLHWPTLTVTDSANPLVGSTILLFNSVAFEVESTSIKLATHL